MPRLPLVTSASERSNQKVKERKSRLEAYSPSESPEGLCHGLLLQRLYRIGAVSI